METLKRWFMGARISFLLIFKLTLLTDWINKKFRKMYAEVKHPQHTSSIYTRLLFNTYRTHKHESFLCPSAEIVQYHLNNHLWTSLYDKPFARYALALQKRDSDVFVPRLLTMHLELPNGQLEVKTTCYYQYMDQSVGLRFGTMCNWGLMRGFKNVNEVTAKFAELKSAKLLAYVVATEKFEILKYVKS